MSPAVVSSGNAAESHQLSHFPILDLRWDNNKGWMRGSRVMLHSQEETKGAVVFVHGWGGTAVDTWGGFPGLVRTSSALAGWDVFFFGYPSREHSTAFCAAKFQQFARDLLVEPDRHLIQPSLEEGVVVFKPRGTFSRVLVCAHSMGAVVVRRALLELEKNPLMTVRVSAVRLLLFAPAHKGSDIVRMLTSGLGLDWLPGGGTVARLLAIHFRSLEDVKPGSEALRNLEGDTRNTLLKRRGAGMPPDPFIAKVLHAENDKVVVQEAFGDDPWLDPVEAEDHRSICKPRSPEYLLPLQRVEAAL